MTRRDLLQRAVEVGVGACVPTAAALVGCQKKKRQPGQSPDVILISLDTVRADHLGCYGYDRPTSPALDEFAARSVVFEDAMSPAPWTLTAHASLLTGLYPSRNGVKSRRNRLPSEATTLAERLREHGYTTGGIVNSHWLGPTYGLDAGFDEFTYVLEQYRLVRPTGVGEKALEWLSQRPMDGKPFFLFVHFYDAHSDYGALPKYEKPFLRPYEGPADGSTPQLLAHRNGELSFTDADIAHLIDLYDAGIRQLDAALGRIFSSLEERGFFGNSLVLVTADHGEEFLDHGEVLHGRTYFQEIIRAPLIVRGPGLPESVRIKNTVSLVDVVPTVLAYVGLPNPVSLDGIDLRFLWQRGGAQASPRFLFGEADWNNQINGKTVDNFKRAVRHGQYKLHYNRISKEHRLYDLAEDPAEMQDVAAAHPAVVKLLLQQLDTFMHIDKAGQEPAPLSPEVLERIEGLGYL